MERMHYIGYMRLTHLPAKRENASGAYLSSSSTNDCRLRASQTPMVRVAKPVKPTGGSNTGALSNGKSFGSGKNGRKKLAREMRDRRNSR